jgi:hypothetical protein
VVRFDWGSEAVDTVAMIWLGKGRLIRTDRFGFLPSLLEPMDDWAVGSDGRVVVARAADYSVEWHFSDGSVRRGPSHPYTPLPAQKSDKEGLLAEMRSSMVSITTAISRSGGAQRMSMRRGGSGSGDGPGVDDFQWRDEFPAFRPERTQVSLRGEAWVQRWLPADSTPRYEVFDEAGERTGSVVLPPGRQLLGFGTTADGGEVAYLVRTDELDLKWLERYRVVR